jgi:hypothetical protein
VLMNKHEHSVIGCRRHGKHGMRPTESTHYTPDIDRLYQSRGSRSARSPYTAGNARCRYSSCIRDDSP